MLTSSNDKKSDPEYWNEIRAFVYQSSVRVELDHHADFKERCHAVAGWFVRIGKALVREL